MIYFRKTKLKETLNRFGSTYLNSLKVVKKGRYIGNLTKIWFEALNTMEATEIL